MKSFLGIFILIALIGLGFLMEDVPWITKTIIFIIFVAPVLFIAFTRVLEDFEKRIKSLENRIYDLENKE
jgi:membrane protein implicated in regulation of membrane protease activity